MTRTGKHLALVTDAWEPQVNGVVRTLQEVVAYLRKEGWRVSVLHPGEFTCMPCPGYPEIPVVINPWPLITKLNELNPDCVHIVSEGPLGITARIWCGWHGHQFTTSFHTRFAEYLSEHGWLPKRVGYRAQKWFHNRASATLVPTQSLKRILMACGFTQLKQWSHGVDIQKFHPSHRKLLNYPRPILMYVGRVSLEKNIEAFLKLDTPGTKVVVGGGPMLEVFEKRYPDAVFVGMKHGEELAQFYASADAFVFPSRTDTFGLVLLEALASGTPIAAYPITGPKDVVGVADKKVGALNEDLVAAINEALECSRDDCREEAEKFSWEESARVFEEALVPLQNAS